MADYVHTVPAPEPNPDMPVLLTPDSHVVNTVPRMASRFSASRGRRVEHTGDVPSIDSVTVPFVERELLQVLRPPLPPEFANAVFKNIIL